MDLQQLGNRIKELRLKNGISQHDLAGILKTSNTAVSRIEAGRQNIGFEMLNDIAKAFNMSLSDLLKE